MIKPSLIANTLVVGFVSMLWLASPAQAEDISRIKLLADACAVCHGTDGRGSKRVPKLNEGELKINDFVETMHGFASGEERSTVMEHIAKGLNEEDYKLLAEHFAGSK